MEAALKISDFDFLIERFSLLPEKREYELPSDYIQQVRYLDKSLSPFPGKFSYDRFPYFREIVDRLSPADPTKYVFVMKGNQCGYTTGVLEPGMMYHIGSDPEEQALFLPDETMARDYAKTKLESCIDNSGLRSLIASQSRKANGSKDTGDTTLHKQYPGGSLKVFGGKSGSKFRNFSFKVIYVDEADAFTSLIKGEGDVFTLMKGRQDAFVNHSKLIIGSTPKNEGSSQIQNLFLQGTQKYFFVPCKHCGQMQKLEWAIWDEHDKSKQIGGIVWENDENFRPKLETVGYKCPYCGGVMKNYDKAEIISRGEWRASVERPEMADAESYHITALYNPPGMYSWEDYVAEWATVWDLKTNRVKDVEKYRVFRNLKQGLPFREQHETITYERALRYRRFGFARGVVPNRMALRDTGSIVLILIVSVDVQKDGLYVDIVGYTERGCNFSVDFRWIEGSVEQFGGPWDELSKLIQSDFVDEDGRRYRPMITLVDSGHYTSWVYAFCSQFSFGVYACKGQDWIKDGAPYQLFSPGTLKQIGLPLAYHINTGLIKDRISGEMNRLFWNDGQLQPAWYPNFPEDFGDDYFKMYEAEEKIDIIDKATRKYVKTIWRQKFGADNHAFDTRVYNKGALEIFADDICRQELRCGALDWNAFWRYAKDFKAFYRDAD